MKVSKEKLLKSCDDIWEVSSALNGLGSLFEQQKTEISYNESELFGIGQCIKLLSQKLISVEDSLRENFSKNEDEN